MSNVCKEKQIRFHHDVRVVKSVGMETQHFGPCWSHDKKRGYLKRLIVLEATFIEGRACKFSSGAALGQPSKLSQHTMDHGYSIKWSCSRDRITCKPSSVPWIKC